jgi:hypothetical protein
MPAARGRPALQEEAYIVFRDLYVDMVNGNQAFASTGR